MNSDLAYLNTGYTKIMNAGKKAFRVISRSAMIAGAAVGAVTVAAIKSGVEFESAFAGVTKTVEASSQELAQLRDNIIEMSKVIPATASEIAGTMEIAGQLGIATKSLTDFTKTMTALGVATNMSAEESSTALARFANITQMADFDEKGISNWERLGSTVVDLGNKFATTEEEIVIMATRLASTGSLVGLSEAQILSLSTAMSSVGIRAEAGGSTMAKLLKKMQLAVETGSGALEQFASVSDMTGEQFQKTFKDDATVALRAFIGGLNDTERNGKSAIAVLKDMKLDEIRLSNTILALAGAEDVLNYAIETGNSAWAENTALAVEAEKRYQTVESQAKLLKNNVVALGIETYDALRPFTVEVLGLLNTKLRELTASNSLRDWIHKTTSALPLMGKNFMTHAKPLIDGFIAFITWIKNNGASIISVLGGIAGSLASFKIVYTVTQVMDVINKLTATLSVTTWQLLGIIALIGAVVAVATKLRLEQERIKKQNIAEHFGDIALSLKEIKDLAGGILSSRNVSQLGVISSEIEKLNNATENLKSSYSDLEKYSWIRSMGIDLSDSQIDSYKTAIETYVNDLQNYITQKQYTVGIALAPLAESNDPLVQSAIDNINDFYNNTNESLRAAGERLKEAVNSAYEDGLLSPDEEKVIKQAEAALARIQSQITSDKLQSKMASIAFKYSGAALDSESFQALQDELNQAVVEIQDSAGEALELAYSQALHAGSQKEADALVKAAEENYFKTVLEAQAQSINFQVRSIYDAYSGELEPAIDGYIQEVQNIISGYGSYDWGAGTEWYQNFSNMMESLKIAAKEGLSSESRAAIGDLLESLAPTMESANASIERMRQSGVESGDALMQGMEEAISSYNILAAMVGDDGAVGDVAAAVAQTAPQLDAFFQGVIEEADARGAAIFENQQQFLDGAKEGIVRATGNALTNASKDARVASKASESANTIKNTTQSALNNALRNLKAEAVVDVVVNAGHIDTAGVVRAAENAVNNGTAMRRTTGSAGSYWTPTRKANGGIVNHKILSTLAEEGPEVVIPLNRTLRAASLWEKTGELLGMDSYQGKLTDGPVGANINYSPTLQFNGGAPSKSDITDALRMSQTEFERMMGEYLKKQARVSFV